MTAGSHHLAIFNQIRKKIFPWIAALISSQRLRQCQWLCHEFARSVRNQPHQLEVYLSPDDPYSYVLS